MNRRDFTNIGLFVLVASLGILTWLQPKPIPEEPMPPLTMLDPEQVENIELTTRNGETLTLEKRKGSWQMIKPHDTKANEPKIERLLKIANTASTEHFPLPDGDRAQFGLDPPMAELRLDDTRLEIGGTHPIDHRRYVLVGDTVHLINDHFAHHLLAPAKDYAMPQGRIHSANND
jgi:hypothetical protein